MRRTNATVVLALVVFGCDGQPATMSDASITLIDARVAATPDAARDAPIDASPDATPPCNTLVNVGQNINWVEVTDKLPSPAGGTIADGTYVLTSQIEYGAIIPGQSIPVGAETIEIRGTTMQVVKADLAGGGAYPPDHSTDALTVYDATHVVVQETCPVLNPPVLNGYQATPTTISFFWTDIVFTYTKQ